MKQKMRSFLTMLLTLVLVVGSLSVNTITVSADESTYVETNTYVLDYNGTYTGSKWQYFSPYWPAFEFDGVEDYTQSIAFTLYDTANEEAFPVYCTDLETGLIDISAYRRINLEDSTYAGSAAGVLRSIVLKGYPNTDKGALGKAAGVENLTVGEAVAATQAAIWKVAHGDRVEFTDFCNTIDTDWSEDDTEHYTDCNAEITNGYAVAENKEQIESRIKAVYDYLINLEAATPTGVLASEASFVDYTTTATEDDDGTYTVTATATVDVAVNEGDNLTLSLVAGDSYTSKVLENGEKEYTLTIENVSAADAASAITLAIDGIQTASDVYLFDAVGDRTTSQSLIGINDSALPVHAEVSTNDRILIVNKTDNDGKGLQNIEFDIYHVCSIEDYVNGKVALGTGVVTVEDEEGNEVKQFSAPTDADIAEYVAGQTPIASIITDEDGQAVFNFGTDNDGIYIVVERTNTVTTGAISPFFVAIPGGSAADDTDKYVIEVSPKNTVIEEDVEIEKDVTEIDNEHDTYDVGENHTWIIQSSIPAGLATGLKYEISDTLDSRLTLVSVDQVSVAKDTGSFGSSENKTEEKEEDKAFEEDFKLTEGTDYIVTTSENTGEEANQDKFVVALTSAGMEKVAEYVDADYGDYEIRVYFTAYINTTAEMDEQIPNQAFVDYINNVGKDYDAESDIPEVHTGAGQILKVDKSNSSKVLAGATFNVYRAAEEGEEADTAITVEGKSIDVVAVEFYDNADMTGNKVTSVVSDENGKGVIYGLAYGTYYLVETAAPDGYNLMTEPAVLTIDENSLSDEEIVKIYNSAEFVLPSTGGMGTTIFTVIGIVLIGAAVMVLVLSGKKKRA